MRIETIEIGKIKGFGADDLLKKWSVLILFREINYPVAAVCYCPLIGFYLQQFFITRIFHVSGDDREPKFSRESFYEIDA